MCKHTKNIELESSIIDLLFFCVTELNLDSATFAQTTVDFDSAHVCFAFLLRFFKDDVGETAIDIAKFNSGFNWN